ncbi:MAG: tRNA (adenosine(37)-N6)-dimethylallyltransferase MiaA [Gammaproteobacteria bacterium]|nr:tRNA (adenosine(37)-N6)-dimethylallyltransferase MiaA [Gammaproteobacteria bacterium]
MNYSYVAVDAILLSGPTASGKSAWALALAERLPLEIVSIDSAQVYRGFDIGAAKPDAATRARVPHHLLDLRAPHESFSAGECVAAALDAIAAIRARGRLPLLVGGTMLYFNSLVRGIARLPSADPALRAAIDAEAAERGWPAMHAELAKVDPVAAARIHPNDPQRIQRALEVQRATGVPISVWQRDTKPRHALQFARFALVPEDRGRLHANIAARWQAMLDAGFVEEVRALRALPDLPADATSLRAVGYRQLWGHLAGEYDLSQASTLAIAATRQLAKRQITWINADPGWRRLDPDADDARSHWFRVVADVWQPTGR